jgi:hypothetical protein
MSLAITIPKAIAAALVSHAAKGNTRFAMNSVLLEIEGNRVILTSSDTHRLVCYSPAADTDTVTLLAEYVTKVKAEQKAKVEANLRAYNAAAGNHKSEEALAPEIKLARDNIEYQPLRIILSIPAFKGRLQKIPRSTSFLFSLESIRPDEQIDGQFPRYQDIIPATLPEKIGVEFKAKSEYEIVLKISEGFNTRYLQDAAPVLEYMGTLTMMQQENGSPYIAMRGDAPWRKLEADGFFLAELVMPVSG